MQSATPNAPERTPPGWIYDDSGDPIVHLMAIDPNDPEKDYAARSSFRGGPDQRYPPGFSGSGSPEMKFRQLFICDPNGVTLELNFQEA